MNLKFEKYSTMAKKLVHGYGNEYYVFKDGSVAFVGGMFKPGEKNSPDKEAYLAGGFNWVSGPAFDLAKKEAKEAAAWTANIKQNKTMPDFSEYYNTSKDDDREFYKLVKEATQKSDEKKWDSFPKLSPEQIEEFKKNMLKVKEEQRHTRPTMHERMQYQNIGAKKKSKPKKEALNKEDKPLVK